MLEALHAKYGLTVQEARTCVTSHKRDTKLSLTNHAMEIKKLVEAAFAGLPRMHRQEMTLDLFCNSMNHAYLQRHLLAMKPQSFTEAVQVGNEYLEIMPSANPGMAIRQIEDPYSIQVTQSKPAEMEVLLEALHQLTAEVSSLKQHQKTTTAQPKNKGLCWKCGKE